MTTDTALTDRPLVTFALFAYNQEAYIREAIEGAFAQTYEPLEIILSDDCSGDRTFEIMQEMAAAYAGPHKVKVRRSEKNAGFGSHIKSVVAEAQSDWIVVAAGDDISFPERTSTLSRCWSDGSADSLMVHSAWLRIAANGTTIGIEQNQHLDALRNLERTITERAFVVGATAAWNRRLFSDFPEIADDLMLEDQVLQGRTLILGKTISYCDVPLIKYRLAGVTSEYKHQTLAQLFFGIANERLNIARRQQRVDMQSAQCSKREMDCIDKQFHLTEFRKNLSTGNLWTKLSVASKFALSKGNRVEAVKHLSLALFPNATDRAFRILKGRK